MKIFLASNGDFKHSLDSRKNAILLAHMLKRIVFKAFN